MQNQDISLRSYPRLAPPPLSESRLARRGYLIICLAIYGGSLGAASLLINLLSRTKYPDTPEHMMFTPTLFLSGGAFVVCAIIGGLMAYSSGERDSAPRTIVQWLSFGFIFGLLSPIITGSTLPITTVFLSLEKGVITLGEIPSQMSGALFRVPSFSFTHGVFGLFTGLMAGAIFGIGSLLIYTLRDSTRGWLSIYGPYLLAVSLSILFYTIAAFGPAPTLARFG